MGLNMPSFDCWFFGFNIGGEFWILPKVEVFKGEVFDSYQLGWFYFGLEAMKMKKDTLR